MQEMDYFRKYLGAQQGDVQPSGAETVERLVDRAQSSTLLDDRRDAVRALKALSKKFRLEVGTQAMEILIKTLQVDRSDAEITDEDIPDVPDDLGGQFTEIFVKHHENVSLLLSLLEEYDFHVRWPTVKLLTILLTNRSKDLQECILVSPMGVSKLMDLLSDSREIIRNDALLLLIQLTKSNANIQKIVAFENAFERLLEIVREEGNSDGGIVVEDCLLLLTNLLKNNTSNQNFFRESSHIQRLTPFFDLESEQQKSQAGWSAQKVTNIHLMLTIVRILVSPDNPQQQTSNCQRTMFQCGLLQQLCIILMASGVPADVLTETINTVSEVIRGNLQNQEHFASVLAPSNPPRPAIVVLLMSMVNEKQPFTLRCAVLYCFQSFLYKNEVGQSQIVQTLLPTSSDAGQLLCGGLFSGDSLSNWFASVALLHAIQDNPNQKEQLLRVQLATSLGSPPVSLLQQCCNILAQGGKLQTRIGLLMLLCGWLADSQIAVAHFLLITQVSASDSDENELLVQGLASLRQIIEKRIGFETFTDKLTSITKFESYTKAAKRPHSNHKQAMEVIFDYEFTRLFKKLETEALKAVSSTAFVEENKKKMASMQEHEKVVNHYKNLIQEQDQQLTDTKKQLEDLQKTHQLAELQLQELKEQVQQLKDQNSLLKAQRGSQNVLPVDNKKDEEIENLTKELEKFKLQSVEKDGVIERLKNDLTVSEAKVLSQFEGEEDKENNPSETAVLQATVNRLNSDLQEVRHLVTEREQEINRLEELNKDLNKSVEKLQQEAAEAEMNTNVNNVLNSGVSSLNDEVEKLKKIRRREI
ncbi:hypothetical protein KUTeg_006547 [Tegillarca granosa]|uniref:Vesicle tethering protein Uso1/P115-like head domain-containing protein n=1 Tax=Tegillarca granosa TaxID=220873 RepID=A0ABQ9FJM6_TEGGR|nr:hypothetical protein KUTeg_006547 [Tegillarca granosa]